MEHLDFLYSFISNLEKEDTISPFTMMLFLLKNIIRLKSLSLISHFYLDNLGKKREIV